jgi:hypothetical protein
MSTSEWWLDLQSSTAIFYMAEKGLMIMTENADILSTAHSNTLCTIASAHSTL